jgi:inhibitor of KinA sporulation pathway (predicted exonuclease)
MAIRKDKIVVVDLEMTCWEGFDAPPGQENEIIEIGICVLNPKLDSMEITHKRSIMVKPTCSVISPFCTDLTSITPQMVEERGVDFPSACTILEQEYDTRNRLWASWGSLDRKMFWEQCKRRKIRYPFSKKHSNLKRVFQDAFGTRMGLARAMTAVGIEAEGTMHRGDDDAYNTAMLLKHLIESYGLHIMRRYGF